MLKSNTKPSLAEVATELECWSPVNLARATVRTSLEDRRQRNARDGIRIANLLHASGENQAKKKEIIF